MHGGLSDLLIRSNRLQQAVVAPDMGYTQRFDHIACNRFQRQRGAYAVEFALVFPLFFLIVYATLTYGLIFTAQQSLNRSEEHTSELQSLMRISYAVFCLKKKIQLTYKC